MRLAARLPYRAQLGLGRILGGTLWYLLARHRRIALTNLALCFPELTEIERARIARDHFRSLGTSLFEVSLGWWGDEARLRRLIHVEGIEHLDQAVAEGRGVLLLSAHFTTLEVGGRLLSMLRPIDVTYRPGRDDPMGLHLRGMRDRLYERAIPKENVREVLRRLKAGHIVWYAPDQNFGGPNRVYAPFFGRPAASNPATARLARITGARVVPFFTRRRDDGSGYDLIFLPALSAFPSDDLTADTATVNGVFEALIRGAPAQYLWVHKRFKLPPPGVDDPY